MASFLIARLPSHPKSLEVVEFMQKKNLSFRLSTNFPLMNCLLSSGGGESRQLAVVMGLSEEFEQGKEEVHVIANMTCIFPFENKVEVDSTENTPPIENPVPTECIVKEENDDSAVDQPDDRNPRLEMPPAEDQPVEPMDIPIVGMENPLQMDAGQVEVEIVDDHQEEREMNSLLNQVEDHDAMNEDDLLTDDHGFDENDAEIAVDVTEQDMATDELLGSVGGDDHRIFDASLDEDLVENIDVNENMEEFEEDGEDEEDVKREDAEETEERIDENTDDEDMEEEDSSKEDSCDEKDEDDEEDVTSDDEPQGQKKKKSDRLPGNPTGRLLFACLFKNCSSSYKKFTELEEHMEIHSGKQDFFCDVCKKSFSTKAAAIVHIQKRQKKECCECGKKFSRDLHLLQHHRCHTGEKPLICKTCGRGFAQLSTLKSHMLKHTGEKAFSCGVCKKRFAVKAVLKVHERTHTGEKPYKCNHCDFECSHFGSLHRHRKIHTGDKPYSCSYCEKRFSVKQYLKSHELMHTGEKPYECSNCGKKFTQKGHFNDHRRLLGH